MSMQLQDPNALLRSRVLDWLTHQSPAYKRANLARAIGVSPRHLNNFLQGSKGFALETRRRTEEVTGQRYGPDQATLIPEIAVSLRDWLRSNHKSVAEFAALIGKPEKTVEDWVYRNRTPSHKNRALIYAVTSLRQFRPQDTPEALEPRVSVASADGSPSNIANQARVGISRLMRDLRNLASATPDARELFRTMVSGADVGYLRSLLAALLDEERLSNWRTMTSYRPTLGGRS